MRRLLRQLCCDQRGASSVEYGLILSMIVLAMITALGGVANESNSMWTNIKNRAADASAKARG